MLCPFCGDEDTKVIDSRLVSNGSQVRRRRQCVSCDERFTTYEVAELVMPKIVKRDGRRQVFDEERLRAGMLRALEKRPVSVETYEGMVENIKHNLRVFAEREIPSATLGEWVMNELRKADPIAYVRFASVYRDFQDVHAFSEEVTKLSANKVPSE